MIGFSDNSQSSSKERFRLQFQSGLREYLARNSSAAEAFGIVWTKTLQDVRIIEAEQAELYWELVQWARSYDLYTASDLPARIPHDGQNPTPANQASAR